MKVWKMPELGPVTLIFGKKSANISAKLFMDTHIGLENAEGVFEFARGLFMGYPT